MKFFWFREILAWIFLGGREVAGWLFVLVGFLCFYLAYQLGTAEPYPNAIAMGSMTITGIVVFRGGIHLLKVAIAARVCQQTQDRLYLATPPALPAPSGRPLANPAVARRPGGT